ncbi:MAG TPA: hypothetical protein VMQ11_06180 [Alphaproteobacteria bacterium]|nr:hypothetical protein [Alphaproteobacteria bacterium]
MGVRWIGAVMGIVIVGCSGAWGAAGLAANMTGPIDLGTVQLSPTDMVQRPPQSRPTLKPKAPSRPAAPLKLATFFGSFAGHGLADGDDSAYFGVTQRDLDVQISPAGEGGFSVAWTTVLRAGGDPKAPNVRRRSVNMTFAPGPRPGLFHAIDNGDPLGGGMVSWARISGNTLMIQQFDVLADGRHEIQTYARTLAGTGMKLVYTRDVDGERTRHVRGDLVKNGN